VKVRGRQAMPEFSQENCKVNIQEQNRGRVKQREVPTGSTQP
jgi:hypothetical protein